MGPLPERAYRGLCPQGPGWLEAELTCGQRREGCCKVLLVFRKEKKGKGSFLQVEEGIWG